MKELIKIIFVLGVSVLLSNRTLAQSDQLNLQLKSLEVFLDSIIHCDSFFSSRYVFFDGVDSSLLRLGELHIVPCENFVKGEVVLKEKYIDTRIVKNFSTPDQVNCIQHAMSIDLSNLIFVRISNVVQISSGEYLVLILSSIQMTNDQVANRYLYFFYSSEAQLLGYCATSTVSNN